MKKKKLTRIEIETDQAQLWHGDCLDLIPQLESESVQLALTSPPYNIGKSYETKSTISDYLKFQEIVLNECWRVLSNGGSLVWQVGNYISPLKEVIPIDLLLFPIIQKLPEARIRNRIVWEYPHGQHCRKRFSGRYEVLLWISKGQEYTFNLDSVRIPQKDPLKRYYKGPNKGKISSHPLGKNPTDVWRINNVKANHPEKTTHPCQFPIELAERVILSLTNQGDCVLDPFSGVASTGVAAVLNGRRTICVEKNGTFIKLGKKRIERAITGEVPRRQSGIMRNAA